MAMLSVRVMNILEIFTYEANHGMTIITDCHRAVTATSVEEVARKSGKRISKIKTYLRAYKQLQHPDVQTAARQTELSLSVVLDLATAVFPLRKHKNRHELIIKLCYMLKGLTADQAGDLMVNTIREWVGDTTKRRDAACMHKRVGRDGKRRLVAVLSAPIAARIDTILHKLADRIKEANPTMQYDHAYAQALIQKITSVNNDSNELFGPMFMIGTSHHFHADGKITSTDGALVNISDVVNEEIAPTGWAAVTGTSDDSPVIPMVGALVKVHNRFASAPQRLVAILETLVCAWPGCDVAASKCQAHHITAHKHGGETKGTNLTMLCKHHNGKNDDDPERNCNGRIERDLATGRPGFRRRPSEELVFNSHPVNRKTIISYTQQ